MDRLWREKGAAADDGEPYVAARRNNSAVRGSVLIRQLNLSNDD
jgi:hypothetical protein